ncbi:Hypothetical predicted protein [Lecanosticta acicola]|uniref:DUF7730 domain-containing protein n=1 Tax=Lecanosticta acicola TaxID=111012 RepID=A0AAI9EFY1_9PEZI|nr:Hypothetical predicted protein [Lecanosticta acicola]
MDYGHYNCRDYHISPHFAPTTLTNEHRSSPLLYRHESFEELEQRSRSPASLQPKFPLLKLPLELRRQIFQYLLPRTLEHHDPNPLASHIRRFSAVRKRVEKGMILPPPPQQPSSAGISPGPPAKNNNVVWQKGNVRLLQVCRQLHGECAELLYGENTFLLFITYSGITFRFSWLTRAGMAPNRRYEFLELLGERYLALVKRVIVNVDHVDSYTGMIKFNVSGKGLTHGLRKQVRRLVDALQPPMVVSAGLNESGRKVLQTGRNDGTTDCPPQPPDSAAEEEWAYISHADAQDEPAEQERRLAKVLIRVSNGNAFLDQRKSEAVQAREGSIRTSEDLEEMLEPFGDLRGVREAAITGAVTQSFSAKLRGQMMSEEKRPEASVSSITRGVRDFDVATMPQLCVYGNDL